MHLFFKVGASFKPQTKHLFYTSQCFYSPSQINSNKDYYKTLGLPNKATASEIKKSFYQLAKKYHPDVAKGQEEKFKEINEAYEILGDENKRKEYDEMKRISTSEANDNNAYQQYQQKSPQGNYNNNDNSDNNNKEQKYYYYEVKTEKGTYRKSYKQDSPFGNGQNQDNRMGINEEIIQEFMKTFYGNKMNQHRQNPYIRNQNNGFRSVNKGFSPNDDFMRQNDFRKEAFGFDYEDFKTYEIKKEEEIKRKRDYEKLQREKQVNYMFLKKFLNITHSFFSNRKSS